MKEVKIFLEINDFLLETIGILDENILKFVDKDVKYEFDFDNFTLKRESCEFYSFLDFKKENDNSIYILKDIDKQITNNLVIKELQLQKNIVIIRYEIEEEVFFFKLSYEEE